MVAEWDVLRIRHPDRLVRIMGAFLFFAGLMFLGKSVLMVLGGGVVGILFGIVGIVLWAYSLKIEVLLTFLRWEFVVDRGSRTVTRRVWVVWPIRNEQYPFDAFESVELRRLGADRPGTPAGVSVVLVGPGLTLDVDDPGQVPLAAIFRFIAIFSSSFDRSKRLEIGTTMGDWMGLKLQDESGLTTRPAVASPKSQARLSPLLDSGDQVLKISRLPKGMVVVFLTLVFAGSGCVALVAWSAISPPGGVGGGDTLWVARTILDLLTLSILPLIGVISLTYGSSVLIDFPSRLVQRRGSFLGSRWDESFSIDQFEAVLVREIKIPLLPTETRTVYLFGSLNEFVLYDDRNIPKILIPKEKGLDRGQRCRASAERLAELCGLPMQVVQLNNEQPQNEPIPAPVDR